MLIGAGLFWNLLCVGQHHTGLGNLTWQKTHLGWVLGGSLTWPKSNKQQHANCHTITNAELSQQLAKFWDIEENTKQENNSILDSSDNCEKHFVETTTRDINGRFIVKIPFKETTQELGNSLEQAKKRFFSVERKLSRDPELKKEYVAFMQEYESLGHMSEIPNEDDENPAYYLPHHAVRKESSTTTKTRVVFDGSAKTSTGISINEIQHVGPTVQRDLISILISFRKHKYVLSADIAKMYRQILINKEHRKFQRILWRTDSTLPLQTYELNTVTYGTASAPYLATPVLHQVGLECAKEFPQISHAIKNDFYVDDLLTGTDSLEDAKQLKHGIEKTLLAAGFELRKWATNDHRILEESHIIENKVEIKADKDPKTLGLSWSTSKDELHFSFNPTNHSRVTKRTILSQIAKIFDPLGVIGPIITQAKIIMQQLWQLKIGWDESVSQDIHTQWTIFCKEVENIINIAIPRRVICNNPKQIELHGFSDASEKAYGACIFIRSQDKTGLWSVRLLYSKSRVAPLKSVTLPRLELCGALLVAQIAHKVKSALDINIDKEYYWTDSTITLAWIKSSPNRWKTFVANRTLEIRRLTMESQWNHVASQHNPADLISRGTTPTVLQDSNLWWYGPAWLTEESVNWPSITTGVSEAPEARQSQITLATITVSNFDIFSRYSDFMKLIRITAYCLRFIKNTRSAAKHTNIGNTKHEHYSSKKIDSTLTTTELDHARCTLLRLAQRDFTTDMKALTQTGMVHNSSTLISLKPFIDDKGLIRVGGRLTNAPIPFDQKHPVVIPAKHRLTELITEYEHKRLLHAGCQATMASIRSRYWPLSCKDTVKWVIRRCINCFKAKPVTTRYVMGTLPASRVTPTCPFHTCGVDYAGPLIIKERGRNRTTIKTYICIFVCFATKAIHIELATDLSSDAFLNCLRRFIARRGKCRSIHSDNGTNFIGSRNELNELGLLLNTKNHQRRVQNLLNHEEIEWHLIPPHSPHFGGLWESAAKPTKHHLKRVIGEQRLTYEELYTLLTQIESCLNSRPLYPLSNDPNDLNPLTPGHFLIGDAMTTLPQEDLREVKENRLNRFQLTQQLFQHFWQRWQKEYLHNLQQRNKWKTAQPSQLRIGALAIVKEDNLPPLKWRLGRITQLHTGTDGVTRVISIKTTDGIMKRPVTKICLLPLDDEDVLAGTNKNITET